jgi:fatty-acyl-CoA synthase
MSAHSVSNHLLSPVNYLYRSAKVFPDKIAVINGSERYTYAQFQQRVFRLANALTKRGICKGDKVAFICPNIAPMLEAHYAVPMIGAVLVSINIRLSPGEIEYIINHSDAKALFVDNEFAHTVLPVLDRLTNIELLVNICDASDEKPLDGEAYEDLLAGSTDDPVSLAIDDEYDIATINYTSGTTGRPKGVMYHHRGAYLNALGEQVEFGTNY